MQKEEQARHLNTRRLRILPNYQRIREMKRKPQVLGSGSSLTTLECVVAGKQRQASASSSGNPQFQQITPNELPKSSAVSCTNKLKSRILSIPANYLLNPALYALEKSENTGASRSWKSLWINDSLNSRAKNLEPLFLVKKNIPC